MKYAVFVALVGCATAGDDIASDQEIAALEAPCAPVRIVTQPDVHTDPLATGRLATVLDPKPGGYFWELADPSLGCQGIITAGQGTSSISFTSGYAGCTMTLRATDAQNCSGERRIQVDFVDVPAPHVFHSHIDTVAGTDVIRGCGGGRFCPDNATTREEMARIVLRGREVAAGNTDYQPPACVPSSQRVFDDVPFHNPYCPWIEQLWQDQITSGCGSNPLRYCPTAVVTRAQMAVFLLAAHDGPSFHPPPCVAGQEMFADVPANSPFCASIEELARRHVTGGCATNPWRYCPDSAVTRGQMAVFTRATFGLVFP